MTVAKSWQNDWMSFAKILEKQLCEGVGAKKLETIFGSATVQWRGKIEEIDFDEYSAVVFIRLPIVTINVGGGNSVALDGLTLTVPEKLVDHWKDFSEGDEIEFEAKTSRTDSPFTSIDLKTLSTGKTILMIQLFEGVPVATK